MFCSYSLRTATTDYRGISCVRPLRVHYYGPVQNPFTLIMRTMSVSSAESISVGNFIGSDTISNSYRATATADFTVSTRTITVPANPNIGTQTVFLPEFFRVIDDNINEMDEIFVLAVEIGADVSIGSVCFLWLHKD
ncbi:hypothetical protein GBAR_LOCUS11919 [Geodia barretti]|uniref:Calx-beta domain-containing protein n=1 Tax=Geodia barretti TaxID=519541 RepID=A0AA35WFT9_GEOBA|nr:hypothetical protein GBAR_LOCUS11919 [Geodia barretti]